MFAAVCIAEQRLVSLDTLQRLVSLGKLQRLVSLRCLQRFVSLSSDWYRWVFAAIGIAEKFADSAAIGIAENFAAIGIAEQRLVSLEKLGSRGSFERLGARGPFEKT
jgi:hypothetical protein